jgi:hypothetical protein
MAKIEEGAVTFIDVLGWKGKWKEGYGAINILSGLIERSIEEAFKAHEEVMLRFEGNHQYINELRGGQTEILSISDTIAIFTKGPAEPTLAIHGLICKVLIPESIRLNIPLRGATAFGKYLKEGNIMIGPAIDEAASWHELTNWIGVNLTPSSKYALKDSYPDEWVQYSKIPYKKKVNSLDYCVKWSLPLEEAIEKFQEMGPHVPEIAEKYLNTVEFLKEYDS